MTEFVHLHVHSDYSLTDAAVSVQKLADKAEELGMTHLALTDHGNMFGAMDFISACNEHMEEIDYEEQYIKRKNPIKPIIGCEVYVSPNSRFDKRNTENEIKFYHLVLLVSNREGYYNLVKLCSLAYTEGFYEKPRIDEELLFKYHRGIIALSGCTSGEISRLIQAGIIEEAEKKAVHYRDLFGKDENGNPNFYLEIQDHDIPTGELKGCNLSQKDINKIIADISKKTDIPMVATNNVHYLNKDDYKAHDALLCIGTGKVLTEEKRKKFYGDQFYFKTGDEMAALFSEYPQAISNTVLIANRCNADIPRISIKELPDCLPEFEIPSGYESTDKYLRQISAEGLERRYEKEKAENGIEWTEIQKRAEYELNTIINNKFTNYFLIIWDFIKYAREHNIPVGPGRGSGASSIIAYALFITDINPIKYNLLFERFLNPERICMPDFDIDISNEGREKVINYITQKYGKERVGHIILFGKLGTKAVIKEGARVLGITVQDSGNITKLIPPNQNITMDKTINDESKLQEMEKEADPIYQLLGLRINLEGLNRYLSLHAAGIVIGKKPLIELVPLFKEREENGGNIATQYSMNFLEQCGLVKIDLLGLKTLDIIKHSQELIRMPGSKYSNFTIEDIPEDDKVTFKMLGEGKSLYVFQFGSEGMQDILRQAKPASIEDLAALNAMYRPGSMQNIPRFIKAKKSRKKISYPDPSLEGVLKETYGILVYQEQVMQIACIIAGYSMNQADLFRRAISKMKIEIIEKKRMSFIEGAVKRGFSDKKAGEIYDILAQFAPSSFCKSHAVAYAKLAYQSAYLKANFPDQYKDICYKIFVVSTEEYMV